MSKNTIKTIVMVVAIILTLSLAAGWIAQTVVNKQKETAYTAVDEAADGLQLDIANDNNGIKLMSARIASEDYDEYGVSALAESAYTLNATVSPSNAPDKSLKWELGFANPSSSWASGKTPSDYVTLSTSGTQATLACVEEFGEPIFVTATSNANKTKSARCRLNYKQKITGVTYSFGTITYSPMNGSFYYNTGLKLLDCKVYPTFSESVSANYSIKVTTSSVYTVPADNLNVRFEMLPTEAFVNTLRDKGYVNAAPLPYIVAANGNTSGTVEHFFDAGWAESIVGAPLDANSRNALISALGALAPIGYNLFCYIGDAAEPVYTYNILIDFNDVNDEYQVDNVSFDKTEIEF